MLSLSLLQNLPCTIYTTTVMVRRKRWLVTIVDPFPSSQFIHKTSWPANIPTNTRTNLTSIISRQKFVQKNKIQTKQWTRTGRRDIVDRVILYKPGHPPQWQCRQGYLMSSYVNPPMPTCPHGSFRRHWNERNDALCDAAISSKSNFSTYNGDGWMDNNNGFCSLYCMYLGAQVIITGMAWLPLIFFNLCSLSLYLSSSCVMCVLWLKWMLVVWNNKLLSVQHFIYSFLWNIYSSLALISVWM